MRIRLIAAVAVVGCVGLLAISQIAAQRAGITAPPTNGVAVVNMASITQNSVRLNKAMEALKKEYLAKGEELKKEGERGNQLTEEARKLPAGTPERKEAEQKLLKLRADYELHGKKVTNDTREGETKIMYSLTREVRDELARYCAGQRRSAHAALRTDARGNDRPAADSARNPKADRLSAWRRNHAGHSRVDESPRASRRPRDVPSARAIQDRAEITPRLKTAGTVQFCEVLAAKWTVPFSEPF